ncbi:MAG: DNA-deoxyinosine glycosylase [Alteromonadaceae bacterium]|nr:MAG: DNA-deoxyinosine glycosylase [Alteromonadaceae bacterium]
MEKTQGFSPRAIGDAHIIILGSMPGKVSLSAAQYYAHSRNAFWAIIETHFSVPCELPYEARLNLLTEKGVALWDVMKSCTRESSLDSDIVASSIVPNDLEGFFLSHPNIRYVFLNGAQAMQSYVKHVLPALSESHRNIPYQRLPSTSPANAAMTLAEKIEAWSVIAQ